MRRSPSLLTISTLIALAAGVPPAASLSAPAGSEPTEVAPASAVGAGGSSTVTLITGQRVRVDTLPDGRHTATALPAPDGSRSQLRVVADDDALYVLPAVAQPYVADGSLDRELFNVTGLIEQGYDDATRDTLPVIVDYADDAGQRSPGLAAPAHSTRTAVLESLDAVAARAPKSEAEAFWRGVVGRLGTTSRSGKAASSAGPAIEGVWLDGTVRAELSESVPQIGAPAAWDLGYDGTGVDVAVLDTGYDATHPDLTGVVTGERDFTDSGVQDRHGHGTHVATTVAGSGAASAGQRRGVAPGANLMIGKVLGDDGSGQNSWLIDGMEWAVEQGADIISMSLSSEVTDGTDPLSQAVNELTRSSGTLFVAAAGNEGPDAQSVRAPGVADEALSVGAVDDDDRLADFSSRGPRFGDHAVKPDLTAPGVGIVAARAAGTSLGSPVDDAYTALSGTSMATPHVAGAAAILRQRHPDWTVNELRSALTATAVPMDGDTIYEQGAGRVDVARAITQTTFTTTGTVDFGRFTWPHDGTDPVATRQLNYRNDGTAPVTLDLAVDVTADDGSAAPEAMFTVEPSSITVPAGASAQVELTADPNLGATGLYGGRVTASTADGSTRLHTTVGLDKEPEMVEVTVEAIGQDGRPASGTSSADLWSLDTDATETGFFGGKGGGSRPVTFRVPPGTYSLLGFLFNLDEAQRSARDIAVVSRPELELTKDTHLVLDARSAAPVTVRTPQRTEHRGVTVGYFRSAGAHEFNLHYVLDRYIETVYATATAPVQRGAFEFTTRWDRYAPEFDLRVTPGGPLDAEYAVGSPRLDGRHRYRVVDAGAGADLGDTDLDGALALLRRSDEISMDAQVRAAAEAGAAVAIVHHDRPGWLLLGVAEDSPIPSFTISQADGEAMRAALAEGAEPIADVRGTAVSPYLYDLMFPEAGRIPGSLDYDVEAADLARLDTTFVGSGPQHAGHEARHAFRPYDTYSVLPPRAVLLPSERVEWVSAGDTSWRQLVWAEQDLVGGVGEALSTYQPGHTDQPSWFAPVVRPGVPDDVEHYGKYGMPGFREGDAFTILIRSFLDGSGHSGDADDVDRVAARLFREGTLVAQRDGVYGTWPASPDPARYRLELDVDRDAPWWRHSTATRTAWEFTSSRPAGNERRMLGLLQVDYDVRTSSAAHVDARRQTRMGLTVHRQGELTGTPGARLRLWVRDDDGAAWQEVRVSERSGGRFTAVVDNPDGADAVSLRIEARTPDGAVIEQTVERAYLLAGR